MPAIAETTVFQFDELDERAKEKARNWWRQGMWDDTFWHECVIEAAQRMGGLMGIDAEKVYFSGFSSQGDGACFIGSYAYAKGGLKKVREEAPSDTELHRIARELQEIQRRHFYGLSATIRQNHYSRYSHEHSVKVTVYDRDGYDADEDTAEGLADILRNFMRWIYRQLEREWDYQNADDQVDESIRANEYTFTEDGRRYCYG